MFVGKFLMKEVFSGSTVNEGLGFNGFLISLTFTQNRERNVHRLGSYFG